MAKLTDIEGIGPVYEEKLKAKKNPEDFHLPALTLGVLDDSWKL